MSTRNAPIHRLGLLIDATRVEERLCRHKSSTDAGDSGRTAPALLLLHWPLRSSYAHLDYARPRLPPRYPHHWQPWQRLRSGNLHTRRSFLRRVLQRHLARFNALSPAEASLEELFARSYGAVADLTRLDILKSAEVVFDVLHGSARDDADRGWALAAEPLDCVAREPAFAAGNRAWGMSECTVRWWAVLGTCRCRSRTYLAAQSGFTPRHWRDLFVPWAGWNITGATPVLADPRQWLHCEGVRLAVQSKLATGVCRRRAGARCEPDLPGACVLPVLNPLPG